MSDFTLPLGTLLTKREAGLMGYSIMGGLFAHTTVNLPDGSVLMLFREERVQRWGMERIAELRQIRVKGGCVSCGATGILHTHQREVWCLPCYEEALEEEAAYDDLEQSLARLLKRHARRWQKGKPLRDLIGNDGHTVKEIAHHLMLEMLEDDFYGAEG